MVEVTDARRDRERGRGRESEVQLRDDREKQSKISKHESKKIYI